MNRLFRSSLSSSAFLRSKAAMRAPLTQQRRFLDLHEYQSKGLAERFNVRVQKGYMAETPEETEAHATQLLAEGNTSFLLSNINFLSLFIKLNYFFLF